MKLLFLVPFWGLFLTAGALGDELLATILRYRNDVVVPKFSQAALDSAVKVPIDVTSSEDSEAYQTNSVFSSCGRIERSIFHPPSGHLFSKVSVGDAPLYDAPFFSYKVVVDSVEGEATYLRAEGYAVPGDSIGKYFLKTDDGWKSFTRKDFILKRIMDGTRFTFDLFESKQNQEQHAVVHKIDGANGTITMYYPKFNHYIMDVVAGNGILWSFNPVDGNIVLKILTYSDNGNQFCLIRTIDWSGTTTEGLYMQSDYGSYTYLGHSPWLPLGYGAGELENLEEPDVADVEVSISGDSSLDTIPEEEEPTFFSGAKLIEVNFPKSPTTGTNEGWTLDVKSNPNGDYERTFQTIEGTFISKLVDHDIPVFEEPGYAIKSGCHFISDDGKQFLSLEVFDEEGHSYDYYYEKKNGAWARMEKHYWLLRKNTRAVGTFFGIDAIIDSRDLNEEELASLSKAEPIALDIGKPVYYAWSTEHSTVHGVITRDVYTAVDGHVFNDFNENGVSFFKPSGPYVSTKAIHYKAYGLELLVFNGHDTKTGRTTLHHFMKHRDRWIPLTEDAYAKQLATMLTLVHQRNEEEAKKEIPMTSLEEEVAKAGSMPIMGDDPYAPPHHVLNLPLQPRIDGHTGGLKLKFPPNKAVIEHAAKCEHIRLEIRGYRDERYNISITSTSKDYKRAVYKPSNGYIFDSVYDFGIPVLDVPGYTITECHLDEMPNKEEYFLQVNAYDEKGYQYVFYFYKTNKYFDFQEISRKTYTNLRHRSIVTIDVDISKTRSSTKHLLALGSRHFNNVYTFLPRANVLIKKIKHGSSTIWKYDDRDPVIVTRVVTFIRGNIRGCLFNAIDENANEIERLLLNVDPKTNDYVLFRHRGEMFSLFRNYLRNRKTGFAWWVSYMPNEIDWTKLVRSNTRDHEKCQKGANIRKIDEREDDTTCEEDKPAGATDENIPPKPNLPKKQTEARKAMAAKKRRQTRIADRTYFSETKAAMSQLIHKGGVVWDSNNSGDLCLDFRKHRRGRKRLIECEIMSPNGHVEIRYFLNTHNGMGDYTEISYPEFGSDF